MTDSVILAPVGRAQSNGTCTRAHCNRLPQLLQAICARTVRCGAAADRGSDHAALAPTSGTAHIPATSNATRTPQRTSFEKDAIADHLSAPLTENNARKARRAGITERTNTLPDSGPLTRNLPCTVCAPCTVYYNPSAMVCQRTTASGGARHVFAQRENKE